MDYADIVKKTRSYRRFNGQKAIAKKELVDLVDLARITSSGANRQYLKYMVFSKDSPEGTALCNQVFQNIKWAGYLSDWDGPVKEEQPTGYIVLLRDTSIFENISIDEGIAAQTILMGATDKGFGGCFIGSFNKGNIEEVLSLSTISGGPYQIALIIALGYPVENVVLEDIGTNGITSIPDNIKYYRDKKNIHHVPKRTLSQVLL